MDLTLVLLVSLVLQLIAAALALRLAFITGRQIAWTLITLSQCAMALRRGIVLASHLSGTQFPSPVLTSELIGLAVSAGMVAGIGWIVPVLRSILDSERRLGQTRDELERRFEERSAALLEVSVALEAQLEERAQMAAVIREERDFIAAILDTAAALVMVLDTGGRVVRFNRACERITGLRADEVAGRPFWEMLALGQGAGAARAAFQDMLGQVETTHDYEYPWLDSTGQPRTISWSATTLRDDDGAIKYIIATGVDITERKQAEVALQTAYDRLEEHVAERTAELKAANDDLRETESALRQREEWLRTLINAIPDIVCFKDGQGRWLIANNADLVLFQLEGLDYRGKTDAELADYTPFQRDALLTCQETDERTWLAGGVTSGEEVIPIPAAPPRTFDVVKIPLFNADSSRRGLVVIGRDITERKQAEQEREALIRELDAFAHTVAHDLKNPLNLIVGFADAIEDAWGTLPDSEVREYLHTITWSGRKMSNIINELLLLAGIRGREAVERAPLDMGRVVNEVLLRLLYMTRETQAEIVQPASWPSALGYGPWVEEVWANYISNGLKYGGQPPRLELGGDVLPGGMVRFWVRDHGAGIAIEDQARLFTPFTQLDQVRAKGHGLGLSIVQRIVEKLGGRVGVESAPGQGSTFIFTLPAAAPDAQAGAVPPFYEAQEN